MKHLKVKVHISLYCHSVGVPTSACRLLGVKFINFNIKTFIVSHLRPKEYVAASLHCVPTVWVHAADG